MNINIIILDIDNEISTRSSDRFGIKVGGQLYKQLADSGRIKLATFSAFGTGAFPEEKPAYAGKYFIFHDRELDDYAYAVGVPKA